MNRTDTGVQPHSIAPRRYKARGSVVAWDYFVRHLEPSIRITALVLFSACHIALLWNAQDVFFLSAISAPVFLCRSYFFTNGRVYNEVCGFLFWVHTEFHFFVSILVSLLYPEYTRAFVASLNPENTAFTVGVGAFILVAFCLTRRARKLDVRVLWHRRQWKTIPLTSLKSAIIVGCVFAFAVSYISWTLGISQMGVVSNVRLPFKLAGLMNMFRVAWAPLLSLIAIDILFDIRAFRQLSVFVAFFVVWLFLETFIRTSRGFFISSVELIAIWLLYRGAISRKVVRWFWIALIIAIAMAPVVTSLRYSRISAAANRSGELRLNSIRFDQKAVEKTGSFAVVRRFIGGATLAAYHDHMNGSWFHNHVEPVLKIGGSAKYHTRIIKGVPEGVAFSAGTSGPADAYLLFGVPGLVVFVLLICALISCVDGHVLGFLSDNSVSCTFLSTLVLGIYGSGFDGLLLRGTILGPGTLCVSVAIIYVIRSRYGR